MPEVKPEPHWDKTVSINQRLAGNPLYEESTPDARNGIYAGRLIIGRDTPINGGVYLGGEHREAIVVDDKKQPQLLETFSELLARKQKIEENGGNFEKNVVQTVLDLTVKKIPYDLQKTEILVKDFYDDTKAPLGDFILNKAGICRHQALLAGYLLEKCIKERLIRGRVSIDRNFVPGAGGHAWVRYADSKGNISIIDPAIVLGKGMADTLEKMKFLWPYDRPPENGEKQNSLANLLARMGVKI